MVKHLEICSDIQQKVCGISRNYSNDVILNTYSNKLFATSQIIHIGLTQRTNRLCRDNRNGEICFWVFSPTTTRSGDYAFLAAIPAGETIFIGSKYIFC